MSEQETKMGYGKHFAICVALVAAFGILIELTGGGFRWDLLIQLIFITPFIYIAERLLNLD